MFCLRLITYNQEIRTAFKNGFGCNMWKQFPIVMYIIISHINCVKSKRRKRFFSTSKVSIAIFSWRFTISLLCHFSSNLLPIYEYESPILPIDWFFLTASMLFSLQFLVNKEIGLCSAITILHSFYFLRKKKNQQKDQVKFSLVVHLVTFYFNASKSKSFIWTVLQKGSSSRC